MVLTSVRKESHALLAKRFFSRGSKRSLPEKMALKPSQGIMRARKGSMAEMRETTTSSDDRV